jgi:hypothetical protein
MAVVDASFDVTGSLSANGVVFNEANWLLSGNGALDVKDCVVIDAGGRKSPLGGSCYGTRSPLKNIRARGRITEFWQTYLIDA